MNEEKKNEKILTEDNYNKSKKKIQRIAIIIFIVGLLIGGSMIGFGITKLNKSKDNTTVESKTNSTEKANNEIQTKIDALVAENDSLELEINKMQTEKSKIFNEDKGFSDRYYEIDNKIKEAQQQVKKNNNEIIKLEGEQFDNDVKQSNDEFNNSSSKMSSSFSGTALIIFGIFIICAFGMIALSLYIWSKNREIAAFTTQSVVPVAKEGLDEIAPSIGNVAKEISKGIKKGQSGPSKCPNCGSNDFVYNEKKGKRVCSFCHTEED